MNLEEVYSWDLYETPLEENICGVEVSNIFYSVHVKVKKSGEVVYRNICKDQGVALEEAIMYMFENVSFDGLEEGN